MKIKGGSYGCMNIVCMNLCVYAICCLVLFLGLWYVVYSVWNEYVEEDV